MAISCAGFGGGSVVTLLLLWKREQITASKGWRRAVGEALSAIAVLPRLFGRSHLYGLALAAIALYWFGDIFCLWACVQAFGGERPLPDLILAYATGYALTRRTLPLGGAGARARTAATGGSRWRRFAGRAAVPRRRWRATC